MSNICSDSFRTSYAWNSKITFYRRLCRWLSFFFSRIHPICRCISFLLVILLNWSTALHYNCHDCWTFLKQETYFPHSTLQFSAIIFIIHPQYVLSWKASALVNPHLWSLLLLTMKNMRLSTTLWIWYSLINFFWIDLELNIDHLCLDAWVQLTLCCHGHWQWYQW